MQMRMNKKKFRIGELAKKLKLKKFVIRFWEKEFNLKSDRSQGGQRFYTQEDFKKFCLIKELLYERKFTIPGAKEQLRKTKEHLITPAKHEKSDLPPQEISNKTISTKLSPDLIKKINDIKQQLIKIKNMLK